MLFGVDKSYGIEQVISSCRSTGRVEAKSADGTVDGRFSSQTKCVLHQPLQKKNPKEVS